ncbi:PHB depolymerase family esterase [Burkholderia gladioli]|uniref:Esterase n=1 Tax=Burkholderia gladioli TaxID=28095 RepID=A0A2A7SHZ3_BURGA|nr:PHB depolymerase family esterase [Burkholderia gladioli]ATF88292.1 esterase [Burkholderia gladioli pv. gladioli]TWC96881.1 poly(hydroxyalkanoate) depolymerase family esterase [Burkholderia sp. SJZ091]MBJ9662820.1 PHB depolymerase family esterase [Burkholderia gladioli]MBJ9711777.1 PHB depolymerase family esterase [Burkholderia gladioli]MBU9155402.1 PHB depolymerase family esterase [Burkholderia gladioli]
MPRRSSNAWLKLLAAFATPATRKPKRGSGIKPVKPLSKPSTLKPKSAPRKRAGSSLHTPSPTSPKPPKTGRGARSRPTLSPLGTWTRSFHSARPAPGQLVNHLTYLLYRPPLAKPGGPLVVMLHGCKQTAEAFALGTRIDRLADRHGFSVLLPEQSTGRHPHRCWNWFDPPAPAPGSDADAVASLVRAMIALHGFDPARVYLAGMSAGAGLAAQLGLHEPSLFAALGLHSGALAGAARSSIHALRVMQHGSRDEPIALIDAAIELDRYPGMPVLIVHGELDGVVAKINAEQAARQWLRVNGLVDASGEATGGTRVMTEHGDRLVVDYRRRGRAIVRVCMVRGLGHAWSGGDDRLPFNAARGPDASAMLWAFFRTRRRALPVASP